MTDLIEARENHSRARLSELRTRISSLDELKTFPNLVMFATGSYARLDASAHSDVDLFFVNCGPEKDIGKIDSILMFSQLIRSARELRYPEFSADGLYLELHRRDHILEKMGGRDDDHMNYFTARMLLLLESTFVFNEPMYNKLLEDVVGAYCRDFQDYERAFRPTFLVNDIVRFWKTLCLNYEYDRNLPDDRKKNDRQDTIRNFKLKFSRLLTCFSMILVLSANGQGILPQAIIDLAKLTPRQRLAQIARIAGAETIVNKLIERYRYFLEKTQLSTENLEAFFNKEENETQAFANACEFGDILFDLLVHVTKDNGYLRYVLV